MDYAPVNLAPKGVKQGDYFTTTHRALRLLGHRIRLQAAVRRHRRRGARSCRRSPRKCADARPTTTRTDEDLYGTADPLVNVWDLGADPMKFGKDRILLAEELLQDAGRQDGGQGRGLSADAAWRSACC